MHLIECRDEKYVVFYKSFPYKVHFVFSIESFQSCTFVIQIMIQFLIFRSLSVIQAQVRRELIAEREKKTNKYQDSKKCQTVETESPSVLAAKDIFFKCPLLGAQVLTRDEWNKKIREFLYEQLEEEKGLTACLILHSLNKSPEKVRFIFYSFIT